MVGVKAQPVLSLHPTLLTDSPGKTRMSWLQFPSVCQACRAWPSQRVCANCLNTSRPALPRCPRCALIHGELVCPGLGDRWDLPWRSLHASVTYEPPWSEWIQQLKFQGQVGLVHALADVMLHQPPPWLSVHSAIHFIPMPSTRHRLQQRGFNLSDWLCHRLIRRRFTQARVLHVLQRQAQQTPQSQLRRDQRWANMANAFVPDPKAKSQPRLGTCVLVDDVMTTGATLMAAAMCLQECGVSDLQVWVLARTPAPHEPSP